MFLSSHHWVLVVNDIFTWQKIYSVNETDYFPLITSHNIMNEYVKKKLNLINNNIIYNYII